VTFRRRRAVLYRFLNEHRFPNSARARGWGLAVLPNPGS